MASGPTWVLSSMGSLHPERRHARHQRPLELRRNPRVHDEAFGGDATLAVVDGARLNGYPHRPLDVRAGHHEEWIAPAQFQHRLLNLPARLAGHLRARRLAAGERHRFTCGSPISRSTCAEPINSV